MVKIEIQNKVEVSEVGGTMNVYWWLASETESIHQLAEGNDWEGQTNIPGEGSSNISVPQPRRLFLTLPHTLFQREQLKCGFQRWPEYTKNIHMGKGGP